MNSPQPDDFARAPLFEADPEARYTLDVVAEITGVSVQTILHYHEQGLVAPVAQEGPTALQFDDDAIRALRRIEHLRTTCEMNVAGLKLMLSLLDEVERLHADLRARR